MSDRALARLFMVLYIIALTTLSVVTTPPADLSAVLADLPPMTVGYAKESIAIDGSPDGYWQPDETRN